MRVQLPPTPTLAAVARDVMRARFRDPPDTERAEWRVDRETYDRVVTEMNDFERALGRPGLADDSRLAVCGIPLLPVDA